MKAEQKIQSFEVALYAVVLIAALGIMLYTGRSIRGDWQGAAVDWLRIVPFLLVFVINNFVLCPRLLFRERYGWYLAAALVLALLSVWASDFIHDTLREGGFMPEPGHRGPEGGPPHPDGMGPRRPGSPQFFFGQAIVSLLLIGFNTGVKVSVRYAKDKITQGEKDRQHLSTELAYLRNQVSPHFLMNTLNNIHALVEIDKARAQDALVKLSRLMRYLLYETETERVPLQRELEFIGSYIELMRLRYGEGELSIRFDRPADTSGVSVPAFLFLSFIENAFKHGIRAAGGSFIRIAITLDSDGVVLRAANSVGDRRPSHDEASGIGTGNVRKRLDLLYGERYSLETSNDSDTYEVILKIPF